jgi:hypothetical protein
MHLPGIADIGDYKPMFYPIGGIFIQCQPGNCPDCPRNEDESVRIPERAPAQVFREKSAERYSG